MLKQQKKRANLSERLSDFCWTCITLNTDLMPLEDIKVVVITVLYFKVWPRFTGLALTKNYQHKMETKLKVTAYIELLNVKDIKAKGKCHEYSCSYTHVPQTRAVPAFKAPISRLWFSWSPALFFDFKGSRLVIDTSSVTEVDLILNDVCVWMTLKATLHGINVFWNQREGLNSQEMIKTDYLGRKVAGITL